MVKAAIFNMLGPSIVDANVLDLFAGSGALGIEALSRGAAQVTFVDREPRGLAILRQNLDVLGLKEQARCVRHDVVSWLAANSADVAGATVIILDPPYDDVVLDRALRVLDITVSDGTIVVAEHSRRQEVPALERLRTDRVKRYGDTTVTVLRK
jgi:16S rRNA (guanine966-N2)-methyltransferase